MPRHQAVFQASYHQPERFFVYLMLRVSSSQFDDDQNQFLLGAYQLLDFSIGKPLTRFAELFFACENLFDRSYTVGRTPVETLGMPRRYNAGIRFRTRITGLSAGASFQKLQEGVVPRCQK